MEKRENQHYVSILFVVQKKNLLPQSNQTKYNIAGMIFEAYITQNL